MPILRVPSSDEPLTQGDVLQGLRLYATGADWTAPGGSPELLQGYDLSLVISRPCVVLHKRQIIVAAVKPIREPPQDDVKTFDEVQRFLNRLRDGYRRPDRFYLGQMPDMPAGRYYAHLDSLHSIAVPTPPELEAFLKNNRRATLTEEFRRDLHLRVFSAVADLGFDDHGWYSDEDLSWLVDRGEEKLREMETKLAEQKGNLSDLQASGAAKDPQQVTGMGTHIAKLECTVQKFRDELSHYQSELQRRGTELQ